MKRRLSETSAPINKVDTSNMLSTAANVLRLLIDNGFRGTYDPEAGTGTVTLHGYVVEFSTGDENFYFSISEQNGEQMFTKSPEVIIDALAKFLDTVNDYR